MQGRQAVRTVDTDMPTSVSVSRGFLDVRTRGTGFIDITRSVERWLREIGACEGVVTLFVRHTSASLTVQENADPDVQADLLDSLRKLAPENDGYRHTVEGPDDMPAHIKSMLTQVSLSVPVTERALVVGTWQALYLIEHRARPHDRTISLMFIGLHG